MKLVRFDSVGGASGDMILAALADAGANMKVVRTALASLDMERVVVSAKTVARDGFRGTAVSVRVPGKKEHHHRNLRDISRIIARGRMPADAKKTSMAVFERLAQAEAAVHGTTIDRIHFHEVGALDSIADIVGSCIALHSLEADTVLVGPLPLGHGTVNSAHGVLPLPAPAVIELLKGRQVVNVDESTELVTPTGAALLSSWSDLFTAKNAGPTTVVRACGCGFGSRTLESRPNLLRATVMESVGKKNGDGDEACLVLECNLDDIAPELVGALTQSILEHGALDAFVTPVFMKKQRPGMLLTVLCRQADRGTMLDLIFHESTTFGIREHTVTRTVLDRKIETIKTKFGPVRVKTGIWKGRDITRSPEYEDCARIGRANKLPIRFVYESAIAAARKGTPDRK